MQISMFDGETKFVIDKPIRLIELFAGYGSQHLALKYLGVKVESWRICEWAVKSIQAYKDLHFGNDNTDYCYNLPTEQVIDFLYEKGISANYNEPMTREQIKRLGEKCRQIYNNIKATHNFVNIMQAKASDLNIVEKDKYCYVMTYSFPCQDLSSAGLCKGMEKGSGTRSGLLWEVERLLEECNGNLPQVLLMENVPEVIGSRNGKHFAKWLEKLESLGYKCYWKLLNGKDYGIPQNRDRCFMVSILGDYYYEFPQPIKLEKLLSDLLEKKVDEKYYVSAKRVKGMLNTTFNSTKLESRVEKNGIMPTLMARDYKDPKLVKEAVVIGGIGEKKSNGGTQYYQQDRVYQGDIAVCHPANLPSGSYMYAVALDEQNGYIRNDGTVGTLTTDGSSPKHNNRVVEFNSGHPYELSDAMKRYIVSYNGKYKVSDRNLKVNRDIACAKTTREGVTRADASDYISPDFETNASIAGLDLINYRIRKLTPRECWRLMGVKDEDYDKVAVNQSDSSLYHLAGDSIIADVLMAIFSKML